MASVSMAAAMGLSHKMSSAPSSQAFLNPLPLRRRPLSSKKVSRGRLEIQGSLREKAITGLTAAALTASMVMPEVAQAAGGGLSPSLQNFLLSIGAGGVVLVAILGAVIGVSNFDPVKRG